ncbi:hypothetical protein LSG31_23100 [Fodinisporobacter ferrooxydans]|uniref:Uncharacterized protein n=1 Tax=Fodinisporobacter ferrooxydans TaxID=2901836 RepID=A0ABY4CJK5_9BACL|nr:hypothetical protein LSG31_23100 [Alicyclobacillaceae bacterium MYW30-H2]
MRGFRSSFPGNRSAAIARFLILGFFIFYFITGSIFALPAHAAGKRDIVSHHPTVVRDHEQMENVVVIGNNADIEGIVRDTVVVINGNVHLGPHARVGLLIGIGAKVTKESGAHIDESYILAENSRFNDSIAVGLAILFATWAMRLIISVIVVVVPVLLTFALQGRIHKPLAFLETSARRMGMIGLFATVCLIALEILCGLTIIGIPLTLFLLIVSAVAGLIGLSLASVWIGKMAGSAFAMDQPIWKSAAIGSVLMMAFMNVPLLGPLFFFMIWLIGTGAVTMWIWESIRNRQFMKKRK